MKSVAFVIDYPDYKGGAHVATSLLIDRMKRDGYSVDVISPDIPESGIRKVLFYLVKHSHLGWYSDFLLDPNGKIKKKLRLYDTVCCLGEPSISRKIVSKLPKTVRKVLLVHTDYAFWSQCKQSLEYCRFDRIWYPRYDCIGVVGEKNAEKMSALFPGIKERIIPFHNIIKFQKRPNVNDLSYPVKLVSAMRIGDKAKRSERYISIAKELLVKHIQFDWIVLGDGQRFSELKKQSEEIGISDHFHLLGYVDNIYNYLTKADIFVLLSEYEGLPNVIYESMLCGTPVFSTDVGSVSEQISDGVTGWLVENDTGKIVEKLCNVLSDIHSISSAKMNLSEYEYDNKKAYSEMKRIITGRI